MGVQAHHVTTVNLASIHRGANSSALIASQEKQTLIRIPPRAVSLAGWGSSQQPRQPSATIARQVGLTLTTLRGQNALVRSSNGALGGMPAFNFACASPNTFCPGVKRS